MSGSIFFDYSTLMAKASGAISGHADKLLDKVKKGNTRGLIHQITVLEFLLEFFNNRFPVFKSEWEAIEFLKCYFTVVPLSDNLIASVASIIRKHGAAFNSNSDRFTLGDALTLTAAKNLKCPVVSRKRTLRQVGAKEKVKVVW